MATNIDITNPDLLVPGDTVRFDFRILTTDENQIAQVVSTIKDAVATDDRFDYQGSKIDTYGDMKLGRDVQLLSIWATVRRELRNRSGPITYVTLSDFEAYLKASIFVFWGTAEYMQAVVQRVAKIAGEVADLIQKIIDWLPFAAVGAVAYVFFFDGR